MPRHIILPSIIKNVPRHSSFTSFAIIATIALRASHCTSVNFVNVERILDRVQVRFVPYFPNCISPSHVALLVLSQSKTSVFSDTSWAFCNYLYNSKECSQAHSRKYWGPYYIQYAKIVRNSLVLVVAVMFFFLSTRVFKSSFLPLGLVPCLCKSVSRPKK